MSDSLKNLFKKGGNRATLDNKSISEIADETNSVTNKYVAEYVDKKRRLLPHIDFVSASNFVKFGLAEKYYEDAIDRITTLYPYDGSRYEKLQWENSSSFLELHLYDNDYPRSTGYVTFAADGYAVNSNQWGNPATKEYVHFYGGPNTASAGMIGKPIYTTYSGSNVWDTGSLRESNLKFDLTGSGATVEFWIKFGDLDPDTTSGRQVIFDLSNGQTSGSDAGSPLGRFQLYYYNDKTAGNSGFSALLQSGSVSQQTKLYTISDGLTLTSTGSWNHYAIVLQNTGSGASDLLYEIYENGTLANTVQESGQGINEITGALRATVGAAVSSYYVTPGSATGSAGWYKLSASVDEFRYWKTARNAKEVGLNWLDQVDGGVNKEDATNKLGVYYKFNEGITGDAATDKIVLDYSGRITNGTFVGYTATARNTGSAIIESSASMKEFEDPIVRKNNPDVITLKTNLMNSGSVYDYENISSIYRSLPSWIQEEDGENGALKKLVQIMSTYFDSAYLQIKELSSLKDNTTYTSAKDKPYPFMREMLESLGLTAPEMFVEASIIEDLLARGDNKLFADDLFNVKSRIYENVYNNLIHIYKSKGTERAFRNLIRCFGVDEDVIDLKIYADGVEYEISENLRNKTSRKKYINFHTADNSNAVCYQQTASNNTNSTPYLSGSENLQDGFGMTFEADVIFPQGYDSVTRNGVLIGPTIFTASIYGVHTPVADGATTQWASSDSANFQVFAVKQNTQSQPSMGEVKFMLTSSQVDASTEGPVPELTSSAIPGVYAAKRWNFAVKIAPSSYPQSCMVTGSCEDDFKVEFYGVNVELGENQNEFYLTGTMTSEEGKAFMRAHKRFYVGANRQNFTGSMLQKSDVKISSARAWLDVLDNNEILAHAKDPTSFGRLHPYRQAFMMQGTGSDDSIQNYIPRINTRLLDWDFELVTSSSAGTRGPTYNDAGFDVIDVSSGSLTDSQGAGWLGNLLYLQHTGRGEMFFPNLTDVVETNYVFMQKQQTVENVDSSDLVKVMSNDDFYFDRTTRPMNYMFSIEKSMNDAISRQMLSYFATITDFNNLIGESVNRYRQSYKNLEKLREVFFSHVENDTIEFEKYLEYYKWLDQSVTTMLLQLIPASANFAETTRTVVESHALERNKYWNKFPTLESKFSDPEDPARGINELLYDWKHGHHPVSNLQSQNCFWWHQKAERNAGILSSSDAGVNADRAEILAASQQTFNRKLNSVYEFRAVEVKDIRAGSNAPTNAKEKSLLSTFDNVDNEGSRALYHDYSYISGSDLEQLENCDDVLKPTFIDAEGNPDTKKRIAYYTHAGFASDGSPVEVIKENAPFTFYSSSAATGYVKVIHEIGGFEGIEVTNLHNDSYGPDYETPLQGPFTEKYVGGYQYRHVDVNYSSPDRALDTRFSRPEGYRIVTDIEVGGTASSIVVSGPATKFTASAPDANAGFANRTRETYAKRPVNIANIQQVTSSGITKIGNFEKNYQVVQTSGRKANNLFIESLSITNSESLYVTGVVDYSLPERTTNKTVITERFSAPGSGEVLARGTRDYTSEEYSPYNAMPWRNLSVRQPLDSLLRDHCGQYGLQAGSVSSSFYNGSERYLDDVSLLTGSYQKNNRNTALSYEKSADPGTANVTPAAISTFTASTYDNWFVQHAIPQSDSQYMWITSSMLSSKALGYATASDDITFISSSDWGYIGNELPSYRNTAIYTQQFASDNGVSWKPNDFVGLNTIYLEPVTASSNTLGYPLESDISNYINTAENTELLPTFLQDWDQLAFPVVERLPGLIQHRGGAYGFNSWKQIRAGQSPIIRDQKRTNIMSYLPRGAETVKDFGSNYLNLNDPTRRHNPAATRRRAPVPLVNYVGPDAPGRRPKREAGNQATQEASAYNSRQGQIWHLTESVVTSKYHPLIHEFGEISDPAVYVAIADTYGNNMGTFTAENITTAARAGTTIINDLGINVAANLPEQFHTKISEAGSLGAGIDPGSDELFRHVLGVLPADQQINYVTYRETVFPREQNTYLKKVRQRENFIIDFWRPSRDARTEFDVLNSQGNTIAKQSMWPLDGRINPTVNTASVMPSSDNAEGEMQNRYSIDHGGTPGSPGTAVPAVNYNRAGAFGTGSDASYSVPWETAKQAGKDPFYYDSYDEYAEDMKRVGKDYTVIPEFKISDYMDFYITEKEGDFTWQGTPFGPPSGFLNLTGAVLNNANPPDAMASSSMEGFYKVYSTTDFLRHFEVLDESMEDFARPTKLTLNCSAMMKFLPYKGFYPAQRTVELANLFSASYSEGVTLAGANANFRTFLQPFFMPGILYNTIKAGIAVDTPIYLNKVVTTDLDGGTGDIAGSTFTGSITSTASFRAPFESLLQPESYLGSHKRIADWEQCSGSTALASTASWDGTGDARYRLAMHNFLAESIDFFLKDGELTSFASKPDGNGFSFPSNTGFEKWEMDIKLNTGNVADLSQLPNGTMMYNERVSASGEELAYGTFGPPVFGGVAVTTGIAQDYPFMPPHYASPCLVRISFTPPNDAGDDQTYTLQEILQHSTIKQYHDVGGNYNIYNLFYGQPLMGDWMQISASVSLPGIGEGGTGLVNVRDVSYDAVTNKPISVQEGDGGQVLVIQTKYETPIFDFTQEVMNALGRAPVQPVGVSDTRVIRGIWHQYGELPTGSNGVYLEVADSEVAIINEDLGIYSTAMDPSALQSGRLTGSLAQVIGMPRRASRLGQPRASKTIKEAVVAIPFRINDDFPAGRQYYTLDPENVTEAKRLIGEAELRNNVPKKIQPIYDQLLKMKNYVFPPQYDFLTDDRNLWVPPIAMYIFEFEHTLGQKDITDIWQNLPPDEIATAPFKTASATISHSLLAGTFLAQDDNEIPDIDNIKWIVFKVKQRANWNYFKKTLDTTDDSKFQFNFNIGGQGAAQLSEPAYSYNWPYDFFSLVELVKIDATTTFKNNNAPDNDGDGGGQ